MSEETTVRVSAVAEEFANAENFWKQRAITRAIEVDALRAKLPAEPEPAREPERTPPDESRQS